MLLWRSKRVFIVLTGVLSGRSEVITLVKSLVVPEYSIILVAAKSAKIDQKSANVLVTHKQSFPAPQGVV